MTGRPWYAHWLADYDRDTADLSLMEHGAYRLLMDHYYRIGGPLPASETLLFRVLRSRNKREHVAIRSVLGRFFVRTNEFFSNARADKELAEAQRISRLRSAIALQQHSKSTAIAVQELRQSHTHSKKQESESEGVISAVGSRPSNPKPQRWPKDAVVSEEWIDLARQARAKHQLPETDLKLQAELFVNHWSAQSGARGVKADWLKTWINWALRSYDNVRKNNRQPRGRDGTGILDLYLEERQRAAAAGDVDAAANLRDETRKVENH